MVLECELLPDLLTVVTLQTLAILFTHMNPVVIAEVLLQLPNVEQDPLPGLSIRRVRWQRHVVEVELPVVEVVVWLVRKSEPRPPEGAGAAHAAPVDVGPGPHCVARCLSADGVSGDHGAVRICGQTAFRAAGNQAVHLKDKS